MDWMSAVEAMRVGKHVQRAGESGRKLVDPGNDLNPPIFECGTEPCFLSAAWTDHERPVMVFRGTHSKLDLVPDDEDRAATDWMVTND